MNSADREADAPDGGQAPDLTAADLPAGSFADATAAEAEENVAPVDAEQLADDEPDRHHPRHPASPRRRPARRRRSSARRSQARTAARSRRRSASCSRCSRNRTGRREPPISPVGVSSPSATPAIVAWMPDSCTAQPDRGAEHGVRSDRSDAGPPQGDDEPRSGGGRRQPWQRQPARVEHRDDEDRRDVVDDRDRQQEDLQRRTTRGRRAAPGRPRRTRCPSPTGSPSRATPASRR